MMVMVYQWSDDDVDISDCGINDGDGDVIGGDDEINDGDDDINDGDGDINDDDDEDRTGYCMLLVIKLKWTRDCDDNHD